MKTLPTLFTDSGQAQGNFLCIHQGEESPAEHSIRREATPFWGYLAQIVSEYLLPNMSRY